MIVIEVINIKVTKNHVNSITIKDVIKTSTYCMMLEVCFRYSKRKVCSSCDLLFTAFTEEKYSHSLISIVYLVHSAILEYLSVS